jgi:phosphate transport system ATP-binding protein
MNRIFKKLYRSDLEGVEYAECDSNGAEGCAAIQASNLSVYYNDVAAFRDVSIRLPPCQITALVGPSGCGKTSFLQCLNRLTDLIPQARVEGSLQVGATRIFPGQCNLIALRKRVGMIFQKPAPFPLSIRKNFHLALKEHGVSRSDERDSLMEKALSDVGLWSEVSSRLNHNAKNLSGGQQQRLCIARALALQPEVLLMDEPCSALDPIASATVEDLILSFQGRYTVIMVTHNISQARRIADYAAFFWVKDGAGSLVEHGEATQLFQQPESKLTHAYISGRAG